MRVRSMAFVATVLALVMLVMGAGGIAAQGPTPQDAASSSRDPGVLPAATGAAIVEAPPGSGLDPSAAPSASAPSAWNSTVRYVGSALRPRESGVTYTTGGSGGCVYATSDVNVVWNLPLALPEGVDINVLRIYYRDTSTTTNTTGWFSKYDLYGGLVNEWSVSSTGSGGNDYRDVVITPTERIDYGFYSYVLNWRPAGLGSSLQLCGFRLFYTQYTGIFLPLVLRGF